MEDGVYYIHCDRPGCNKVVGAQRYENDEVAEEEWVPGMEVTEEGNTYCPGCKDQEFVTPEELVEGELEDYVCSD